ncbi:MAG: cell division protein FtsQ/DivIB [Paracoccaceae bacterium]
MRPLTRDYAPSRWQLRRQRLMLTPGLRRALRIGLPTLAVAALIGGWWASPSNRAMVADAWATGVDSFQARPEFAMRELTVIGAEGDLAQVARAALALTLPTSSFDLDLAALDARLEALPQIEAASVALRPGGVIEATVTPRTPVAIWRRAGALTLLDAAAEPSGVLIARAERPDLPILAGRGADAALDEALELLDAARPLPVAGMERIGARRWDLVMTDGLRVQLPQDGAREALDRVVALHGAQALLSRDLVAVDMRVPRRATLRPTPVPADVGPDID